MSYDKQDWYPGRSGGTPLSAERLNHMEEGIAAAAEKVSFGGLTLVNGGSHIQAMADTEDGPVPIGDPIPFPVPATLGSGDVIYHGDNAGTPRPEDAVIIIWVGSVRPLNAANGDIWVDTSGSAPSITTTTLNPMTAGVMMTPQQLVASGTAPIAWAVAEGSLPAGLTLSSAGILHGTPTTAGEYDVTISATNGYATDEREFTIVVDEAA